MNICTDIEELRRAVQAAGWRRIGIDGVAGAGQAQVAEKLARLLECTCLDLDDYLHQNQGGYVDFIDYKALSVALASMPSFILFGVCLREVLANLNATLDGHIYIKRMRSGMWMDEDGCVFPEGVDAAIEAVARNSALISEYFDERSDQPGQDLDDSSPHLSDEIMRYHDTWLPQEVADLVYERAEGGR